MRQEKAAGRLEGKPVSKITPSISEVNCQCACRPGKMKPNNIEKDRQRKKGLFERKGAGRESGHRIKANLGP